MWNRVGLLVGCGSLLALTGCCSIAQGRIDGLEKEIADLKEASRVENENYISLADLFELYSQNYNNNTVLAKRYLKTISLPENPTSAQIDEFLAKVYSMRRSNTDDEFQTQAAAKISVIGEGNASKLIPYLDFTPFNRAFLNLCGTEGKEPLRRAIMMNRNNSELVRLYSQMVTVDDADNVLAMIPENPGLVEAVRRLGLEKKAADIMRKHLLSSERGGNYWQNWLQLIADESTPAEFDSFAAEFWRRTLQQGANNTWMVADAGARLAGMGFAPAFTYLAENQRKLERSDLLNRLRAISNCKDQDFSVWYNANRNNLYFNKETMLWDVKKAD